MLNIEDVLESLSTPLLGIIPESEEVLCASNRSRSGEDADEETAREIRRALSSRA
jgi:septum formation inhibitor-activating ATPase MinD